MEWKSDNNLDATALGQCGQLRDEGMDKFPKNDIRMWFDPIRLPAKPPALDGIKIGTTLHIDGYLDVDPDPAETAAMLYRCAGRDISRRGGFQVVWPLSHSAWKQKEGYEEYLTIGTLWETAAPPKLDFFYQPMPGTKSFADVGYAVTLFGDFVSEAGIPLTVAREGDMVRTEARAPCVSSSGPLTLPSRGLRCRGFDGDYLEMLAGVKRVLDKHAIQVAATKWGMSQFLNLGGSRVADEPPEAMVERFLKIVCGANLPGDRYEAQIHFAFTSVQGLEFVRAFCGPKNELLFPLVELTPEKGVKVLASVGVKPEGYYLQLASRNDLKPEYVADLEARFGTTFSLVPKPEKPPRKKK